LGCQGEHFRCDEKAFRRDHVRKHIRFHPFCQSVFPSDLCEKRAEKGQPSKGPRSREITPTGQKIRFSGLGQNYLIIPRISLLSAFVELSTLRCRRISPHQSAIRI
jgi:hypothetical protein